MGYAGGKDEFITLMRTEGYDVRWEPTRKNITYTTPSGMKCRDERLHDERYLKGAMEREFQIRQAKFLGRIEAAEPAEGITSTANADCVAGISSNTAGMDRNDGHVDLAGTRISDTDSPSTGTFTQAETLPDTGANFVTGAGCGGDAGDPRTGWEAEHAAYLSPALAPAPSQSGAPAYSGDPGGVLGSVAQLGHALERNQDAAPVMDGTTVAPHTDKKTLAKERKKKIALGGAPDDHEDKQQTHSMSM